LASENANRVLRHLRKLLESKQLGGLTDRELLARFTATQDEAAFTALVERHGAMVLSVCRSVLGDPQEAEDACQATFLVLLRKAGGMNWQPSIANWLHEVAFLIARRARADRARRPTYESHLVTTPVPDPVADVTWRELQSVLHEELHKLPGRYRKSLILCCLEGKAHHDAAALLGCSLTTLRGRLQRGRELLRKRLVRRGLALSAATFAAVLAQQTVWASMPPLLVVAIVKAALEAAAGQATTTLAKTAALGTVPAGRGKLVAITGLALLLGVGLWVMGRTEPVPLEGPAQKPQTQLADRAEKVPEPAPEGKKTAVLTGRVLDGTGRPVPHAEITAVARRQFRAGDHGLREDTLRVGRADAEGRFRLTVPADFPSWYPDRKVVLVATAAGRPPVTLPVPTISGQGPVELRLTEAGPIRGMLTDQDGRPATGIRVAVVRLGDTAWEPVQGSDKAPPPFWPVPVFSDGKGEFALPGLGSSANVWLQFQDDRYALTTVPARPMEKEPPRYRLAPARLLTGRVVAADTGKPMPDVRLAVYAGNWDRMHGDRYTALTSAQRASRSERADALDGRADADGYFKLRLPKSGIYRVDVYPPVESGYQALTRQLFWGSGTRGREEEFRLPRGTELRGRAVEAGTGKPIAGAYAYYRPKATGNPHYRSDILCDRLTMVTSGPDGIFRLQVPPGPGQLQVFGPGWEYQPQIYDPKSLVPGPNRPRRFYADARAVLDVPAGSPREEVTVTMRRGLRVTGSVTGPDGMPAGPCIFICTGKVQPIRNGVVAPLPVRGGQFTLPGCDARQTYSVVFLDAVNELGAVAEIPAEPALPPPQVRLQPCGAARLRLLEPDGQPAVGCRLTVLVLLEADAATGDAAAQAAKREAADPYQADWFDPRHYLRPPVTDDKGWATLPALVPGARYQVWVQCEGVWGWQKPFSVAAGETRILPDLRLRRRLNSQTAHE
jgi:RNA polymerase sigma factor (sigma-70 family)